VVEIWYVVFGWHCLCQVLHPSQWQPSYWCSRGAFLFWMWYWAWWVKWATIYWTTNIVMQCLWLFFSQRLISMTMRQLIIYWNIIYVIPLKKPGGRLLSRIAWGLKQNYLAQLVEWSITQEAKYFSEVSICISMVVQRKMRQLNLDMQEPGADCKELISMTTAALSNETLEHLFVSTQQNNIQVSIEYAVER